MQRREFLRYQVIIRADMRKIPEAMRRGDWELGRIIQARVKESSFSMHLEIRDKRIPMRDRAPSRPGMQVYAGETKSRRDQSRGRLPIGTESLAIQNELGIELAWAPGHQHFPNRRNIDAQKF